MMSSERPIYLLFTCSIHGKKRVWHKKVEFRLVRAFDFAGKAQYRHEVSAKHGIKY